MPESRVTCKRNHRLFEITPDGIAIKCRAGECRTVYTIPWAEIDAKRYALYTVTQSDHTTALAQVKIV